MELTPIQTEILMTLINLFHQKGRAVKGEEIADVIDRNPGTVRNQMQALRMLGIVEGVPGPKGGYHPTGQTYDILDISDQPAKTITNIYRNGKLVDGATVCEIMFTTVQHPDTCHGRVRVIGDIRKFDNGDIIKIGPTPQNKLVIRGKVIGRDDTRNILIFAISDLITLPKRAVKECVHGGNVAIDMNITIKAAATILLKHRIRGAPVVDTTNITGIVTMEQITKALVSGLTNQKVRDVMSRDPIIIDGDDQIPDVSKLFDRHHTRNIVVLINGKPHGIVSRDDLVRESTIVGEMVIAPSLMSA
ncbi:MAG: Inosine-5'-monophosphate dehydrogenase [Candidatus Methanogaster sp.]|nr:MAG: Inosine-5'-monophosphate dehydrogenase [ANME-2 cluster archaeon]